MLTQLSGRFVQMVIVLFFLSVVTFVMMKLAPGDPILAILLASDGALSQAEQEAAREALGLNRPIYEQYGSWLLKVVQLDWGQSLTSNREVWDILMERLPATIYLTLGSVVVLMVIAFPLGILAAKYQNKAPDVSSRIIALLGASIPSFWLALLLIYVFAYQLNWLPTMGSGTLRHLVLPSLTLGFVMAPEYIRLLRAGLLDTLSRDYIKAARARGISEWRIMLRHAMRAALLPIVAVSGVSLGSLLTGSVVTESIFGWPGLGSLAIESIRLRDYPVVQGYVLFCGVCFLMANWLSDVGAAVLDPRIRMRGGRRP
ncbi:ABC transporter permease [Xylanibacillus composti]|uniref:Nickel import system permease protein NikB n=1 Tax=Xylanibacillus composti TaxID=1572762 RepID=A0A8J4M2C0_9BACL|nr:nickel ABC transporter permease [Xylanibacillus composti]MDT9723587.1 ABC transporter permease [Xylanibacillus composti]GIQ68376.1 ABC transporter permease [Xylanibacillus composti]